MDEHDEKLERRAEEEPAEQATDTAEQAATTTEQAADTAEQLTDRESAALKDLQNLEESLDGLGAALRRVAQSLETLADARTAFSRIGWAACVLMPLSILLQGAVAVILNYASPGWADTWLLWVVSYAPLYGLCTPLAYWILRSVPAYPPEARPLGFWRTAALFPVGLMLTYAGNAVSMGILFFMSRIFGTAADNPLTEVLMDDTGAVLRTAVVVIAAPVVEELVFRKLVLDRARIYGEKTALMVSAVLFALEHGNISQFLYALFLGLGFGYIYLRTGRLRYTIALHVWINFMGGVVAPLVLRYAGGTGTDDLAQGGAGVLLYGLVLLLLCGGGIAILADNWQRIHFVPTERELPRETLFRTVWANPGMILLTVTFVITSVWLLAG